MTDPESELSDTAQHAGVPSPADRRGLFQAPGFALLLGGQGLSQVGFQFSGLAMPVIAVTMLHASEEQMGYLGAAEFAAFLVLGLLAGGWVDRLRKRLVMLVADCVRALTVLAIPLLFFAGHLEMWQLYLTAAVLGVATVFFDVAYQSYIPILLPKRLVGPANGVLEGTSQVARLGGPGLAGALLTIIAAPVLLIANALGFLFSAACLAVIRDEEVVRPKQERQPLLTEIREGIAFVAGQPLLRRVVASTATSNIGSTIVFTMMPILILRILGIAPGWLGLILTFGAVGGLLGSFASSRVADWWGEGPTLRISLVLALVATSLTPLAVLFPPAALPLLCASEVIGGFSVIVYNMVQVTARQKLCPQQLLGRMNASIRFVVWGVMPIASLLAGWLGGLIGALTTTWVGVGFVALAALPFLTSHYGSMRTLPTEPE